MWLRIGTSITEHFMTFNAEVRGGWEGECGTPDGFGATFVNPNRFQLGNELTRSALMIASIATHL
jgi:hypothetical protein